jgi:hypothetical protein
MKKISYVLVLLLGVTLLQSCVKDPVMNEDPGVAPELPMLETFVMPFQGFDDADTSNINKSIDKARNFVTHFHWFYAASNIVIWNTYLSLHMVIPVASFAEAFNHDPVYQGSGIWLWAYSVEENGETFYAELTAQFLSDKEVQWDMSISQVGGFSKVHWYTGVISVDGSKGSWTVNYLPENPTPYLRIDYQGDEATGEGSIRYTNIIPGHVDMGDYIEYREFPSSRPEHNRAYDVYRIAEDNLLEIEWNEENHNGRVKNQKAFNDDNWHCWDENFVDIDC